jgi:lysophospholipase L1-like esterase
MSQQRGTGYVSYPYLSAVRDAMRDESIARGALFWDLFAVMGGENSMHAWTTTSPPLAGPDHIHFTPAGARKVGKLLLQSLDAEWHAWCLSTSLTP